MCSFFHGSNDNCDSPVPDVLKIRPIQSFATPTLAVVFNADEIKFGMLS